MTKIIERSGELDPRKATTCDDECEKALPHSGIGLGIGPLKHIHNMIANADGIEEGLEIKSEFFYACQSEII